ncbi:MAG TPA: DUF5704 domain-containing protein [Mobilitalea sp.]|nr:DUF5704 domain-containing protein [Mobilitalea sp.]
MKAPDAEPGSTLTIYIPYEPVNPITPTPKPSVTPKPGVPTPTPIPNIPEVEVPQEDSAALPFTEVENGGIIQADNRGGEKFNAILGVPTTESLYGQVTAKEYLLGYTFIKKVGIKYYPIKVTKNYILNWKTATPDSAGGGKPLTETVPVTQTVTVARAYGYWEIENLECYKISNAVLNNYALPNGSIAINPNYFYYSPLSVNVSHSSSEGTHIIPPDEFTKGITLPSETISDKGTTKPTIPSEDFSNEAISAAWDRTGKIKVKSDSLIFNGATVMNSAVTEYDAPDLNLSAIPQCDTFINDNVLYKPNQLIDATKENGHYGSTGSITYTSIANVNPTKLNNIEYPIGGINQVVIHTPVICKPSITADNDKYVQLINPTSGCVQLVLDPDPDLSDFIINISNYGPHSDKVGYYTRDFSRSLHNPDVSYIAEKSGILRNEVRFPFDVYVDVGNDKKTANDEYVKAGTWMTIGRASPRLYLPMWTEEGVYTVDFRTVAVNGENFINKTQEEKNSNLINYVATDTLRVEVSGRIYGLTMYDLSDYPMWEETFRVPNSSRLKKDDPKYIDGTKRNIYSKDYSYTYTLGTNDQYGNDTGRNIKYTFPLVNGSHPLYKNIGVLKTGYMTRFSIETIGSMYDDGSTISIKPSFYFVDSKGKNRTAVDLYYTEEIYGKSRHLVKVGGSTDLTNLKSFTTGDLHLSIPEKEMRLTAKLRKTPYEDFIFHRDAMFGFSQIRLNSTFRTYVNEDYTEKIKALDSYEAVKKSGIIEDDISMRKQHWYGQYYIPNEVHAVAKGFDVMDYADKYGVDYSENFWLKDGYIIVNINIETVEVGKPRLSYTNAINYKNNGNCSMWIMEGPPLTKTDNKGVTFNFYAGDFIIYYANKRASDDYSAGAIY